MDVQVLYPSFYKKRVSKFSNKKRVSKFSKFSKFFFLSAEGP